MRVLGGPRRTCLAIHRKLNAVRTLLGAVLFILLLTNAVPAGAQDLLSHDAFADEVIKQIREEAPDLKVRKAGDLHLQIEDPVGGEFQMFLDNAYRKYRDSPESKSDIIATYISGALDSFADMNDRVDPTRIVPVIKSADFIPNMGESLESSGDAGDKAGSLAYEAYNAELVILFAEDTDRNIRYLSDEHLTENGFPKTGRRTKAIENLKSLLPKLQARGADGIYMLSAGGDYDASLLLFDDLWQTDQLSVKGELVVAVPARNVLVVTGSQDAAGLEAARRIVAQAMDQESYTLTDKLFVYRDGRFVVFGR